MATYYLVGSGNWSNPVIWSLTDNGAGGAGVPSASDTVHLAGFNGPKNRNVNLDINVNVESIYSSYLYVGTINFGSGVHTIGDIQSDGGTFNFQSATINLSVFKVLQSGGTGSINAGTSIINYTGSGQLSGASFRKLNLATLNITGKAYGMQNLYADYISVINPTVFTNGVGISNSSSIDVRKLVAKGGTYMSRITPFTSTADASINIIGSNQITSFSKAYIEGISVSGSGKYYAGSDSTNAGRTSGWIFSDAPKVETLVDAFTGSSINTTKWTVSGSGLSQSGGQLIYANSGGTSSPSLISKEQYLAEGSFIKFKANVGVGRLYAYFANAELQYGVSARRNIPTIYLDLTPTQGRFYIYAASAYTSVVFDNEYLYYRMRENNGTIYLDGSTDGIVFTNIKSAVASNYGLDTTQLIARPIFSFYSEQTGAITIDDFNVDLEPTAEFTATPVSGTTPLTVNFTDQSNFAPTKWSWNFGDGTTSTAQNPSKTYSVPGTYSVSLTAVKGAITRTTTKSNLITASPNVYERAISGGLIFGGGASRRLLASRSISGTLTFGGGVRAVVLRDVEGLQDKRYLYKVYDPDGNYVEVWKDVISELNFTHEINTIGSTTTVELARNSDTLGTTTAPLLTEDGQNLLTEDDFDILVSTQSRNQVGSGSSVDYNNRVDITVFYGSVEPLLTESDEPLLTEDDEELLADVGAPNGRRIFTGFISEINSRYGSSETTIVQLTSYGWDLDQFPITTSGGATTVPFNSYDPSNIASEAIDKFITDSTSYGTYTTRTDSSISPTGTTVSYTFRANTYGDVLDKTLELMPSNWYYRVGLGDNTVYYRERSATPHHLFYLGKHIKAMDLKGSIINSTNRVLFTGGGDPALFINREEVPADRVRRRLEIISDSRVTLTDSAEIISDGRIEQNNKRLFRTTVEILAVQYDIESIDVGQTVGFRNFGDSYVDGLVMQVVGLSYNPSSVQLQLETKPPTINKRLEDLRRNLTITENTNIPDTPS